MQESYGSAGDRVNDRPTGPTLDRQPLDLGGWQAMTTGSPYLVSDAIRRALEDGCAILVEPWVRVRDGYSPEARYTVYAQEVAS